MKDGESGRERLGISPHAMIKYQDPLVSPLRRACPLTALDYGNRPIFESTAPRDAKR
jgi:hypothetical protein